MLAFADAARPMTSDDKPEIPVLADTPNADGAQPLVAAETTPPTGRRQALRDLRRELTDTDLASPGVQKLLLDELGRVDAECDALRSYQTQFHEADKRVARLEERLRTQTAIEIMFGVGVAVGTSLMTLGPTLPSNVVTLLGLVLALGASVARIVKR